MKRASRDHDEDFFAFLAQGQIDEAEPMEIEEEDEEEEELVDHEDHNFIPKEDVLSNAFEKIQLEDNQEFDDWSDEEDEEMQDQQEEEDMLASKFLAPHQEPLPVLALPEPAPVDPKHDEFVFMHFETTYRTTPTPEVLIVGKNMAGNTVAIRIENFRPYFFAEIHNQSELNSVVAGLEKRLSEIAPNKAITKYVTGYEETMGESICGYSCGRPMVRMYKIYMAQPSHVAKARKCLELKDEGVTQRAIVTYEANVPYELRYMVDHNINGCQWIRLKPGTYERVPVQATTCQYEWKLLSPGEPIPSHENGDIAPLRILSYDIEVLNTTRGFPTAEKCPVIVICCSVGVVGKNGVQATVCFTTRECNAIPGATVFCYETERQLLLAFSQFLRLVDPDLLTGWNTSNFDMPFLVKRAEMLDIFNQFMSFTRVIGKRSWLRQQTFQSKAFGARTTNELICDGRVEFDGLTFMLRGVMEKFRQYTLNHIAKKTVDEEKADVHHSQIPMLYNGTTEMRTKLVDYCKQDSILPLKILEKRMAFINGIEQARVTGVPIKWLMTRGQGIKTFSNLLRYKHPNQHVPSRAEKSNTAYTAGGHVEEPRRALYTVPLASLDFGSLYPSIMIAYNICFSTKTPLWWARKHLRPDQYWVPPPAIDECEREAANQILTPSGRKKSKQQREHDKIVSKYAGVEPNFCFVKASVREGVLPKFLKGLLATRKGVKNMMENADPADKLLKSVLDGRQLALKVCCNSVYGFLKAFILTDKDLMSAVTSYGRNMLYTVKGVIASHFQNLRVVDCKKCREMKIDPEIPPKEGEPDHRPYTTTNAFVVYGDTDSVMVNFGDITLEEVARFGAEAAKLCTAKFEPPNNLVFETIKLRSIYVNKKRYAALEIEKIIPGEHIRDAIGRGKLSIKGLESKRRDNAPIGSDTQREVIRILLKEGNVQKAENVVKEACRKLLMDEIDMSQLVITKGLSKTDEAYAKSGSKQQHVELQKRIRARSKFTGEIPPETGERVPFIRIAGPKGAKAYELSEDPLYALRNNIEPDYDYYIDKQVFAAVGRIFTAVYEPHRCAEIRSSMPKKEKESLLAFQRLFNKSLPHMMHRKQRKVKPGNAGMAAFVKPIPKCLKCGSINRDGGACCKYCKEYEDILYAELSAKSAAANEKKEAAWDTCRKCQGPSFGTVQCSNITCGNFFHREKTLIDIEDIDQQLKCFK